MTMTPRLSPARLVWPAALLLCACAAASTANRGTGVAAAPDRKTSHGACGTMPLDRCVEEGVVKLMVAATTEDEQVGRGMLVAACEAGASGACMTLAKLTFATLSSPADSGSAAERGRTVAEGMKMFERACDLGNGEACFLGGWVADGASPYVAGRDTETALRLYEAACADGYGAGCTNAAILHSEGLAVPRDEARAARLHLRACALESHGGCGDAGGRLVNGWGIARDTRAGARLLAQACDRSNAYACMQLGLHLWQTDRPANTATILRLLGTSCDAGLGDACKHMGDFLGTERDPRAAPVLAEVYRRAIEIYEESCGRKHGWSCHRLGEMHRNGLGVPRDDAKADSYFERACRYDSRKCTGWKGNADNNSPLPPASPP